MIAWYAMIEITLNLAIKYNADCVKSQRCKVSEDFKIKHAWNNKPLSPEDNQIIKRPALTINEWYKDPMQVWLYLYDKRLLETGFRFVKNMRPCEDVNFTMRILPQVKTLAITNAQTVFYRNSITGITQNYKLTEQTILSKRQNLEMLFDFLSNGKNSFSKRYEHLCKNLITDLSLMDLFYIPLIYEHSFRELASEHLREILEQYDDAQNRDMLTKIAILAFAKKKYRIAEALVKKPQFEKYIKHNKQKG
jgi:hypothetical protein